MSPPLSPITLPHCAHCEHRAHCEHHENCEHNEHYTHCEHCNHCEPCVPCSPCSPCPPPLDLPVVDAFPGATGITGPNDDNNLPNLENPTYPTGNNNTLPDGWLRYNFEDPRVPKPTYNVTDGIDGPTTNTAIFYPVINGPPLLTLGNLSAENLALYYFLGISINNLLQPIKDTLGIDPNKPSVYSLLNAVKTDTDDIQADLQEATKQIEADIRESTKIVEQKIDNATTDLKNKITESTCDIKHEIKESTCEIKHILRDLENHLKRTDSFIAGQDFDIKIKLDLMHKTLREISEHYEQHDTVEELHKLRKVLARLGVLISNSHY